MCNVCDSMEHLLISLTLAFFANMYCYDQQRPRSCESLVLYISLLVLSVSQILLPVGTT